MYNLIQHLSVGTYVRDWQDKIKQISLDLKNYCINNYVLNNSKKYLKYLKILFYYDKK